MTDAIHQAVTEGEMAERPLSQYAYSNLLALVELLQPQVQELHEYIREIENSTTLQLPMSDEDFEAISVGRNCV